MKKAISLILFLMVVFIIIGCTTMTPEQRKERYDLRNSVGNSPFVGESSYEAKGLAYYQMHGY